MEEKEEKIVGEEKKIEEPPKEILGVASLWNAVEQLEQRETKARDYINASDLGSPYLDRFYKMKGVQPTNPYDSRTLRIFSAGDTFEDLVIEILAKAGVLIDTQKWVNIPETAETLRVCGKYDAKIGNVYDWGKVKKTFKKTFEIEQRVLEEAKKIYQEAEIQMPFSYYRFSNFIKYKGEKILNGLAQKFPDGLKKPRIVEVKSVNSNAFWNKKDYIGEGYFHHQLQTFMYIKGENLDEGVILYISKDDLTLEECPVVFATERLQKAFEEDVKTMSMYFIMDKEPPREPDLIFNTKKGKMGGLWEKNWKIARSPYFTKITGFQKAEEWERKCKMKLNEINRKASMKDGKLTQMYL